MLGIEPGFKYPIRDIYLMAKYFPLGQHFSIIQMFMFQNIENSSLGTGLLVQASRYRPPSTGLLVQASWYRPPGTGLPVQASQYRPPGTGLLVQAYKPRVSLPFQEVSITQLLSMLDRVL